MKFKCWHASEEDESKAREIEADFKREAAEAFGRHNYHYEEQFDEIEVMVREPNGRLWKFSVEADIDISFYAGLEERVFEETPDTAIRPPEAH